MHVFFTTDTESIIIEDLKIVKASADSLTVSWRANHENLTSYLIEWYKDDIFAGNASKIFSLQDKIEYTIESLESCTTYNVTVIPQMVFEIEADTDDVMIGESVIGETASTRKYSKFYIYKFLITKKKTKFFLF